MATPTTEWERVGDRYYRKIKLYDAIFDQELELENHVIAGAPYSGAIGDCPRDQAHSIGLIMSSALSRRAKDTCVSRESSCQVKY